MATPNQPSDRELVIDFRGVRDRSSQAAMFLSSRFEANHSTRTPMNQPEEQASSEWQTSIESLDS